jgi:hypothetical protein
MASEPSSSRPERTPFEKFEAFAKKVVRVPKKEIDEKAKEYEAKRARRPKRA